MHSNTSNYKSASAWIFNLLCVLLVLAALLVCGCSEKQTTEPPPPEEGEEVYNRADELFTCEDAGGGYVRTTFEMSSGRYWTHEGATLWTVWGNEETFGSRTVEMGKPSGYSGGGYGLVICQGERDVGGVMEPVMLVVMINNEGYYIVGKAIGGVFRDFGWWKTSVYLQRGDGTPNKLSVSYEIESGEYVLNINEHEVERFRDEEEPVLLGGRNGYIVVITPYDRMPQSVVTVYFTERR
jgi:hypothetical protein